MPGKYAAIDDGTRLEQPPISIIPPSVQPAPANVRMASHVVVDQGIATSVLTIEWDAADKAIGYDVEWRRGDLNWVRAGRVGTQSLEVRGVYAGEYLPAYAQSMRWARCRSRRSACSPPLKARRRRPLAGIVDQHSPFGIALSWGFPAGATDTERTELWYSTGPNRESAIKLGDFASQAQHQMNGLALARASGSGDGWWIEVATSARGIRRKPGDG